MFAARGASSGGGGSDVGDGKKYDQYTSQWMREVGVAISSSSSQATNAVRCVQALESRQAIEELKAQNDKLQRDVYSLNSKVSLIYECCTDLGVVDRVGDLMHRKLHEFQAAKVARETGAPANDGSSPRTRKKSAAVLQAEVDGIICGSPNFHEVAGFASSHDGQVRIRLWLGVNLMPTVPNCLVLEQVTRETFRRKNMFDAEERVLREQFDIFGNPKQPSPAGSPTSEGSSTRKGDTIDNLLSASGAAAAGRPYGSAPIIYPTPDAPFGGKW